MFWVALELMDLSSCQRWESHAMDMTHEQK
jgi:hypothetical protein